MRSGVLRRIAGRRRRTGGEDGIALLTVVGSMAIITLLLLGVLALVLANTRPARADQDAKTAVAAAQAGVDEYLSRLSLNSTYWTVGNDDAANPALGGGEPVPGTGGAAGRFSYRLLNSAQDIATSGSIKLQVTGTSSPAGGGQPVSRTLIATLKGTSFLNFIYFTDVEATDPSLYAAAAQATASPPPGGGYRVRADPNAVRALCSRHYWEGRTSASYQASSTGYTATVVTGGGAYVGTIPGWNGTTDGSVTISGFCTNIQFTSGDVIQGPFHSNDVPYVQGGVDFTNPDTTVYWPDAQTPPAPGVVLPHTGADYFWTTNGSSPTGQAPTYEDYVPIPAGNQELLKYVEPKTDASANTDRPGCLYTGATRITFAGVQGGQAMMRVLSPNTTDAPARCLDTANRASEQLVKVPPVIAVNGSTGSCSGVGYPKAGEVTSGKTTDYTCTNGTAFVSGSLAGQTTISAANDVVITGDTTYADDGAGTDVLGLIAANNVWVYHPVDSSNHNLSETDPTVQTVHQVDAAILSLNHSFLVQNYDRGAKLSTANDPSSKLNVLGAIAQKYRGAVGTGSGSNPASGYLKNYVYDQRFNGLQPPYFIKPSGTPWTAVQITDG